MNIINEHIRKGYHQLSIYVKTTNGKIKIQQGSYLKIKRTIASTL